MPVSKLIGPPGCGKTTTGDEITGTHIKEGYHPDQIIYTSFTNDATNEAASRIMKTQGLTDRPEYFATEHAICRRLLKIPHENIFTRKWLRLFSEKYPYYKFSWQNNDDEDSRMGDCTAMTTSGDVLEFLEGKVMTERKPSKDIYREFIKYNAPPLGVNHASLETYIEKKRQFMMVHRLYTFSDMINEAIKQKLTPPAKILCVDEAQDCSPAQWELIDMWAKSMDETYLLGDYLQAVFEFSGADPDAFLNYPADKTIVLSQSYRLPKTVKSYAEKIIRTKTKYPFPEFEPRDYMGEVVRKNYYSIDWATVPECFVLCRARWLIDQIKKDLIAKAIPFSCEKGSESPLYQQKGIAYRTILKIGNKEDVSLKEILSLIKYTTSPFLKHGAKTKIKKLANLSSYANADLRLMGFTEEFFTHLNYPDDIMNAGEIDLGDRSYLTRVFSKYGLNPKNKITLTTMHGSKGRERPLVIVNPDLSRKVWNSLFEYGGLNSSEVLLQYVAATRAKEKLWLLGPRESFSFPRIVIPEVNGEFLITGG